MNRWIIVLLYTVVFTFPILPNALMSIAIPLYICVYCGFNYENLISNTRNIRFWKEYLSLSAFYFWLLFSILWSSNKDIHNEIQSNIILPFVFFFIVFFKKKSDAKEVRYVLYVFLISLVLYLILFYQYLCQGILLYQNNIPIEHNKIIEIPSFSTLNVVDRVIWIFKSKFILNVPLYHISMEAYQYFGTPEFFVHYNYVAPCYIMGLLSCLYLIYNTVSSFVRAVLVGVFLLFLFFIYFSPASISKLITCVLLGLVVCQILFKYLKPYIAITVISIMLIGGFALNFNTIISYITSLQWSPEEYKQIESPNTIIDYVRSQIYKSSVDIIRHNPIIGVGIGDNSYELNYRIPNVYVYGIGELGLKNPLNNHSQFLYYFTTSGFIGLILFLWMIATLIIRAIQQKSLLFIGFILIMISSCLFENILSRLWGVTFFSSFLILFYTNERDKAI